MTDHQIHFGRKFYLDKTRGYWFSTDIPRIYAHRWVWINYHGAIPKGCHIHHKDHNKSNNSPENLQLMLKAEHLRLHGFDVNKRKRAADMANKYRPLTKAWHASPEGKAWHSLNAFRCKFGNWEPREYICDCCGLKYKSKSRGNVKFCSNNCKSKWRRDNGLDNIEVNCENCGCKMIKNKYSKAKSCNKKCAGELRRKKKINTQLLY